MSGAPLLAIDRVSVHFPAPQGRVVRAVHDVTFSVSAGEVFGIIGESGSGKSTLGRAIVGLARPSRGRIFHNGQALSDLGRKALARHRRDFAFVFQDPNAALNPRATIGASVREPLDIVGGFTRKQADALVGDALNHVGLGEEYRRRYPHELSGGQKQRVNIARALMTRPQLVVCDEVVAALDVSIQADVLNLFMDLQREYNLTYIFISHDLRVVAHISDRVAVMYLGKIVEIGETAAVFHTPSHPYTQALLSAEPSIDLGDVGEASASRRRITLQGEIPSPIDPPSGCPFRTRCGLAQGICAAEEPPLRGGGNRAVACHFAEPDAASPEVFDYAAAAAAL